MVSSRGAAAGATAATKALWYATATTGPKNRAAAGATAATKALRYAAATRDSAAVASAPLQGIKGRQAVLQAL